MGKQVQKGRKQKSKLFSFLPCFKYLLASSSALRHKTTQKEGIANTSHLEQDLFQGPDYLSLFLFSFTPTIHKGQVSPYTQD
jgi:hypothetical protein